MATSTTKKKKAPPAKAKQTKTTVALKKKTTKKPVNKPASIKKSPAKKSAPAESKQTLNLYSSYESLEKASLPQNYYQTYVTLLSKEPYVLYAYWEIHGDDVDEIKKQIGHDADSAAYTLRVYDVTLLDFNGTNANYWFDLDELHMNHRYISVGSDDATYVCEIGLRTKSGQFYSLARSNFIRSQRSGASQRRDLIWKELTEANDLQNMYVNVRLLNRSLRGRLKPRANWQIDTSKLILNPQDIRLYYQKRVPMMKIYLEHIQKDKKISIKQVLPGNVEFEQTPQGGVATRTKETQKAGGSSDQFFKDKVKDVFPFVIEMTLTVKGKTEPDAEVYLGTKRIPLNENGTFTLHWTLEDGVLPLDFKAHSPKKNLGKSITTSVIRTPTEEHYS